MFSSYIWFVCILSMHRAHFFLFITESLFSTAISVVVLQERKATLFSLRFLLLCQLATVILLMVDSSRPVCWKCFCHLVLLCQWTTTLGNSDVEKLTCLSFSGQDDFLLFAHITCNGCFFSKMVSINAACLCTVIVM